MTTKRVRRNGAQHVTFVESDSEMGVEYEIATLPDGTTACACLGYAFCRTRPKTCRHVTAYSVAQGASTYHYKARVYEGKKLPVERAETFTFRRGITFGVDIPSGRTT